MGEDVVAGDAPSGRAGVMVGHRLLDVLEVVALDQAAGVGLAGHPDVGVVQVVVVVHMHGSVEPVGLVVVIDPDVMGERLHVDPVIREVAEDQVAEDHIVHGVRRRRGDRVVWWQTDVQPAPGEAGVGADADECLVRRHVVHRTGQGDHAADADVERACLRDCRDDLGGGVHLDGRAPAPPVVPFWPNTVSDGKPAGRPDVSRVPGVGGGVVVGGVPGPGTSITSTSSKDALAKSVTRPIRPEPNVPSVAATPLTNPRSEPPNAGSRNLLTNNAGHTDHGINPPGGTSEGGRH
jgi:hypothetical protein